MADKVLVTGAGILSALGVGVEETLQTLLKGETAIGRLSHIQTEHTGYPVGEVTLSNAEMLHLLQADVLVEGQRTVLMGMIAAREAVAHAGLSESDLRKAAFVSGTTVGGMDKMEQYFDAVFDTNAQTDDCFHLRYSSCGDSTELIAESLGRFRLVTTSSTACSSAANSIILGANLIKNGLVDMAVVGGTEALTKFHLNGFRTLMILDEDRCRPFDAQRTGINLGEGAAYLVLESEASARARGARVLAELSGYANRCDAHHQTATSENGEGAYRTMSAALAQAGLSPEQIGYINAHGTGTPNNDETELAAMRRVWGSQLPPFSSTKSFTGHTTSASGSIEAVVCLLALQEGFLPLNLGWQHPMAVDAVPVTQPTASKELAHVVNNSFGFGGNNSSFILSKYPAEHG